ncbi:MAG: aldolase/citrate lyase family protein [Gemmatimonadota bacterium]
MAPVQAIQRPHRFWEVLGPGLLWAAAAIGVSHLVQSTRAGADGGFSLVWVVLLALALKYPFFEYGPRYAAATGESLVEGYRRLGVWAVWVYLLITLATALIIQSAVTLFTAFVFARALGVEPPIWITGAVVLAGCASILWIGKFRALDGTVKVVLALLVVCTLVAAIAVAPRAVAGATFTPWPLAEGSAMVPFIFILALAGWMPSAIDISVWSSLWTLAKNRSSGVNASVSEALLDFRIGYVGTGLIALAFLTLGAGVMHATETRFSPQGAVFSFQLVDLYVQTLGEWTRPVIMVAVLTTMFSTTLTVMDGFPRALARSFRVLSEGLPPEGGWDGAAGESTPDQAAPSATPADSARLQDDGEGPVYWVVLLILAVLTVLVFAFFAGSLTGMVDFATVVSFVTAPVLGYLNLRAVTARHVPIDFQPGPRLRGFSYLGLALLGGTALVFLASLVMPTGAASAEGEAAAGADSVAVETSGESGERPGVLALWEADQPAFGVYVRTEGVEEVVSDPVYDFLFLNLEGEYDPADVSALMQILHEAEAAHSPTLLVRIPSPGSDGMDLLAHRIREVLAQGAHGVVIPHVRSLAEAEAVAGYFRDAGVRVWSPQDPEGDVIAMIMLEDPETVSQARAFAALPGYSMLACGIGSLTSALGGDREAGEAGARAVLEAAREAGLPDMITATPATVVGRVEEGYLALLGSGAQAAEMARVGRAAAGR